MRKAGGIIAAVGLLAAGPVGGVAADTRVTNDTDGSYARYDGSVDSTMMSCSTGRRTQNEPSVAVDPRSPDVMVAGSNDYCAEISERIGERLGRLLPVDRRRSDLVEQPRAGLPGGRVVCWERVADQGLLCCGR